MRRRPIMPVRCFRIVVLALACGCSFASEAPLWFDAGRPGMQARQAADVLLAAAREGLDPRDYDAARIDRELVQASQGPAPDPTAQALLDATLTTAVLRYLTDLRDGRVNPRQIHANFDVQRREPFDAKAYLQQAVAQRRVDQALREAKPRLPMYGAMLQALARYRALADHEAWRAALPALPRRKLEPGQSWSGLPLLARRLEAMGDLPAGTSVPGHFDAALVAAVQSFQERHGLAPDGVLGQATLSQLEMEPSARARQIELSIERLRWTPFLQGPRMIVVNVPEFVLRAYEVVEGRVHVQVSMKIIVGKALDTRTPLFDEDMRFIEFSPYWNVPPSIARKETIPRLRSDPAYFDQQGFEFVTASGQVVTSLSAAHLDAVLHAGWRIRQRPGPRNALGDIKFVFPNRDNIYLHHTPAPQLFERDRRDFSHGCIRVEAPVALARFVLQGEPLWTEQRIRDAMEQGVSSTISLKQPVPVLIAYMTAVVQGGRIFFFPDLYGHDRVLDRELRRRSAALGLSHKAAEGAK